MIARRWLRGVSLGDGEQAVKAEMVAHGSRAVRHAPEVEQPVRTGHHKPAHNTVRC